MIGKIESVLNCRETRLVPAGNVLFFWFVLNKEILGMLSCGVNNISGAISTNKLSLMDDGVGWCNLLVGKKMQIKLLYLLRLKFDWSCV